MPRLSLGPAFFIAGISKMPSGRIMFCGASQMSVDISGWTLNPDYVEELDFMLQNATSFDKYYIFCARVDDDTLTVSEMF
jgi:hypothetical protein